MQRLRVLISMKKFINRLSSDKIVVVGTIISSLFFLMSISFIIYNYRALPPFIPLYHQAPWGMARLGRTYEIFLPTLYVFVMFIGNIILAYALYEKMPLVSRIISVTSILLSVLLFLFILRTMQLIL